MGSGERPIQKVGHGSGGRSEIKMNGFVGGEGLIMGGAQVVWLLLCFLFVESLVKNI